MQKTFIIDAHVHIYPNFDVTTAITSSLKNAANLGINDATNIWLLTERSDCSFFENLEAVDLNGFSIKRTADNCAIVKNDVDQPVLTIFAGRQLVSADNLEVCALATTFRLPDRALNTADTIRAVREAGGFAAINWAPGKWFGTRGQIVSTIFESEQPHALFISDTTMRPSIWPTPALMAGAQKRGFRVICGSDPLPFAGEEKFISSYVSVASADVKTDDPQEFVKAVLQNVSVDITASGRRSAPLTFLKRQKKIMAEKKA